MHADRSDETLTVREVADELKVHPQTVYKLIRDKAIRARRLTPHLIRITRRALSDYLHNETHGTD
jgi:excisionase family DNA binding protein